MKKISLTILISLLLAVFAVQADEDDHHHRFKEKSLKGAFAYLLTGNFDPNLSSSFAEIGLFTADGDGGITASGTPRVNGVAANNVTHDCEYEVNPDGTIPVKCIRTDVITGGTSSVEFLLILADKKEFVQIMFVSSDNPAFAVASITGSARKQ